MVWWAPLAAQGVASGIDLLTDRSEDQAEQRQQDQMRRAEEQWRQLEGEIPGGYLANPEYQMEGEDVLLGRPEMAGAEGDTMGRYAQETALRQLEGMYGGELNAIDRANMAETRRQQDQYNRGAREAALANMQARGMGGSGMELAAQLSAQQEASQRGNAADMQALSAAQQRALQAMGMGASLGTDIRSQGFREDTARRSAIDDFNRENTRYRQGVRLRNTERGNAQEDARVGANWQRYGAKERIAGGLTGQYGNNANYYGQERDRAGNKQAARLGAYGQMAKSIMDYSTSDDEEEDE